MSATEGIKFDRETNKAEIKAALKKWCDPENSGYSYEILGGKFFGPNQSEAFFLVKHWSTLEILFFWRSQLSDAMNNSLELRRAFGNNDKENQLVIKTVTDVFNAITGRLD